VHRSTCMVRSSICYPQPFLGGPWTYSGAHAVVPHHPGAVAMC
jgi:hypothetical protein